MVTSHPSVGIVLYHTQLKSLLLVRQFRPAVRPALCKRLPCKAVQIARGCASVMLQLNAQQPTEFMGAYLGVCN